MLCRGNGSPSEAPRYHYAGAKDGLPESEEPVNELTMPWTLCAWHARDGVVTIIIQFKNGSLPCKDLRRYLLNMG
jgi:hypothetical protein